MNFSGIPHIAFLVALALQGVSLLTLFTTIFIRLNLVISEKRKKQCYQIWHPFIAASLSQLPEQLPKLKKKHIKYFVILWNYYFFSIKGTDQENLILLAKKLNIHQWALKAIKTKFSKKQLMAIVTLGNMHEKEGISFLIKLSLHRNDFLALSALQSLLKIDAQTYSPYFIELMMKNHDWPLPQIVVILKQIGADLFSKPLADAILVAPEKIKIKYIVLFDLVHIHEAFGAIKTLFETEKNPEILSTTLATLKNPLCIEFAKNNLNHSEWFVRLQAVKAIGRLGTKADVNLLIPLLADQSWWVRYRSAEAIAKLPTMTQSFLEEIRKNQTDKFASDMLTQIIAENLCK